jgi:hypothetical protein
MGGNRRLLSITDSFFIRQRGLKNRAERASSAGVQDVHHYSSSVGPVHPDPSCGATTRPVRAHPRPSSPSPTNHHLQHRRRASWNVLPPITHGLSRTAAAHPHCFVLQHSTSPRPVCPFPGRAPRHMRCSVHGFMARALSTAKLAFPVAGEFIHTDVVSSVLRSSQPNSSRLNSALSRLNLLPSFIQLQNLRRDVSTRIPQLNKRSDTHFRLNRPGHPS